jgi:hypothetical protein
MCDLDRSTFLKAIPGAAVLGGEFAYGWRTGVCPRFGAAYGAATRSRDAGQRG